MNDDRDTSTSRPTSGGGTTEEEARHAARRARLRWHCRRGMRELDEAMSAYLDNHYDDATDGERTDFEELLGLQDPELYSIVCGRHRDERFVPIIDKITRTLGGGGRPVESA